MPSKRGKRNPVKNQASSGSITTEFLEHELLHQQAAAEIAQTAPSALARRHTPVDTSSYRRQAEAIVGAVHGMRSGMDIYHYTSTAVSEMYDLIAQAHTFTKHGDGQNALHILEAITEPNVAVQRLALVRRAYRHAGRAEEWQRYKTQLQDTHGRKRKLMDLLRQLL